MKQLMPTYADGKEEYLYLVPPRNKLFLKKNSTSPIHETRYANYRHGSCTWCTC